MAVVTVVTASFFTTIIIAMRQVVRVSSLGDVILILVVGLRPGRVIGVYDV